MAIVSTNFFRHFQKDSLIIKKNYNSSPDVHPNHSGQLLKIEVVCQDKQEFEKYGLTCRIFLSYSDETLPFAQHLWHPFLCIIDCSIALWQVACAYITG